MHGWYPFKEKHHSWLAVTGRSLVGNNGCNQIHTCFPKKTSHSKAKYSSVNFNMNIYFFTFKYTVVTHLPHNVQLKVLVDLTKFSLIRPFLIVAKFLWHSLNEMVSNHVSSVIFNLSCLPRLQWVPIIACKHMSQTLQWPRCLANNLYSCVCSCIS